MNHQHEDPDQIHLNQIELSNQIFVTEHGQINI